MLTPCILFSTHTLVGWLSGSVVITSSTAAVHHVECGSADLFASGLGVHIPSQYTYSHTQRTHKSLRSFVLSSYRSASYATSLRGFHHHHASLPPIKHESCLILCLAVFFLSAFGCLSQHTFKLSLCEQHTLKHIDLTASEHAMPICSNDVMTSYTLTSAIQGVA